MAYDPIMLPSIRDGEDKSSPFGNCIRNSYKHLRKWAKRTLTDSFRIYDRDIANFPLAIDFYSGFFCIHFYSKSKEEIDPPEDLVEEVNNTLEKLFDIAPNHIFWRTRARRKPSRQYEKLDSTHNFFTTYEYGLKFRINLTDYLDTGLFLDHRETRKMVGEIAKDKRVLNLFAYTCSFSVHAAAGGAAFTKSVDLSNTYCIWGRKNFELNKLAASNNIIVRDDCLKYLDKEVAQKGSYDLIIIDPPTISRSKKMDQLFDIQLDYIPLLNKSLKLLSPKGFIFFSTNSRTFKFDETLFPSLKIQEITKKTLPIDFKDAKAHRCWKLSR